MDTTLEKSKKYFPDLPPNAIAKMHLQKFIVLGVQD